MKIRGLLGMLIMSGIIAACNSSDAVAGVKQEDVVDKADERPFDKPLPLNTQPKRLALDGFGHTVGVKADGTVWVWGSGTAGVMGRGKAQEIDLPPTKIPGLTDVVEVAGGEHLLALRKDGTVWSWGSNKYGQLGYETEKSFSATPKQIPVLTNIISVAADHGYSLALARDGSVYAFGSNEGMRLAVEPASRSAHVVPRVAYQLKGGVKVIAGAASVVIGADGKAVIWGVDLERIGGVKGDLFTMPRSMEIPVEVADIVIGRVLTVLARDGSVWAAGHNVGGWLGQGDFKEYPGWRRVVGLGRVVSIATDGASTSALDEKGRVWSWGSNVRWKPEAGVRNRSNETLPVRVPGIYPGGALASSFRDAILKPDGGVLFRGWDNGARGRPLKQKALSGDDAWFVPELSAWTWK